MTQKNVSEENQSTSRVDDIDRHVSQRLRARRMLLGLSQQSLADEVSVSVQQIQKYERATNRISSGKLYHFANFLNVPIEYFFSDVGVKTEPHVFAEVGSDVAINGASERDVLILVRAYNSIKDIIVRKRLLDFVRSISQE